MKKVKNMKTSEVIEAAKGHLAEITRLEVNNIISMKREEDKWYVTFELVEKKSIPDAMDVLGIYELVLNGNGDLVNFERKSIRKRGDIQPEGI